MLRLDSLALESVRVLSQVIAIVNQKGGVGKTTTAVNLGASLGHLGFPTLVVDCDPQANATRSLGIHGDAGPTLYDVLVSGEHVPLASAILATHAAGLSIVPSSPALAGAEVELVNLQGRESRLKSVLEPVRDRFAFILLDCPPSLGLVSVNALMAAEGVIVPVQCEYLSLEGLGQLMSTLDLVRARLNPTLKLLGLVMTMFDPRTNLAAQVVDEVSRHFADLRFATVIPRTVRISEAPSYGETVLEYAPESPGTVAYLGLAAEVVARAGAAKNGHQA